MRSRLVVLFLCVYLVFVVGCNKPPADNAPANATPDNQPAAGTDNSTGKEAT